MNGAAKRAPPWASHFAREALGERLPALQSCTCWQRLASDDERRAVLDWVAFFWSFNGIESTQRAPRPTDRYKQLRAIANKLHSAANELALAPEHARFVAGFAGVDVAKLRAAAGWMADAAERKPYRTAPALRAEFVRGLSTHVKAHTGRYHDAVVAELASAVFPDADVTPNAVKAARARCQQSQK